MNTAQIKADPGTHDEITHAEEGWRPVTNHGYSLRPHLMHQSIKYTFIQEGKQSTEKNLSKPHDHVMMTQMSIKQGIKAFGERGNDALLKELNQPH